MITSDNCRTMIPPYNSLLPYLRAKEAEKTVKVTDSKPKAEESPEDEYNKARKEILRDE